MTEYHLSGPVRSLIHQAENLLETKIVLKRHRDAPRTGYLLDTFLLGSDRNIIIFPDDNMGTLKDFIIAKHILKLVMQGTAYRGGGGKVLMFDVPSAVRGMNQIYLDSLKDEKTRNLSVQEKKEIISDLFLLFHERLMDLPWVITAHILISKRCPFLRNPQVYSLIRESILDMHSLDPKKEQIPLRYFVMHQGMYYARDMLLAFKLSEHTLHPEINIPELQVFRNLDVQQMMEYRWSQSPWVHTKIVGEAMANLMDIALFIDLDQKPDGRFYQEVSQCVIAAIHRWMTMMNMQDWYFWDFPGSYHIFLKNRQNIRQRALNEVFPD
jgi:hypothetical protein